ncbi:MAG: hypothetical protein ACE360_05375 [Hyphomicrobiales bacterium]
MNPQEFVLKLGAALVVVFGVVIWLGSNPVTADIPAFFGDLIFWPLDGLPTFTAQEAHLLSAIGGGIMVGWGLMLWALAGEGLRVAPAFTRRTILTSVWARFVVDNAGSVLAGAPLNLIGNLVFLGLLTLPFTRFFETQSAATSEPR